MFGINPVSVPIPVDPAKSATKTSIWSYNRGDAQLFKLLDAGDGYYTIQNKGSGKNLNVKGGKKDDGTPIIAYPADGTKNEKFKLVPTSDSSLLAPSYLIVSALDDSKVLDVRGSNQSDGAEIILWTLHGRQNQQWVIVPREDNLVCFINVYSGKPLDVNRYW